MSRVFWFLLFVLFCFADFLLEILGLVIFHMIKYSKELKHGDLMRGFPGVAE